MGSQLEMMDLLQIMAIIQLEQSRSYYVWHLFHSESVHTDAS